MTFRGFDMSVCDKIFKREVISDTRFPLGMTCEDSFATYKFFSRADRISYYDKPFYNYYYRAGSISRNGNINTTVIEATIQQTNFININYPEIIDEAYICEIYGILAVYNEYLKRNQKWSNYSEAKRISRNRIVIVLKNKNIAFEKKIQIFMFAYLPGLYNLIVKREMYKNEY